MRFRVPLRLDLAELVAEARKSALGTRPLLRGSFRPATALVVGWIRHEIGRPRREGKNDTHWGHRTRPHLKDGPRVSRNAGNQHAYTQPAKADSLAQRCDNWTGVGPLRRPSLKQAVLDDLSSGQNRGASWHGACASARRPSAASVRRCCHSPRSRRSGDAIAGGGSDVDFAVADHDRGFRVELVRGQDVGDQIRLGIVAVPSSSAP